MKEKVDKILTICMLALAVVTTVLVIMFAFAKEANPPQNDNASAVVEQEAVTNSNLIDAYGTAYADHIGGNGFYNTFYMILFILIAVSLVAMLVFWVLRQVEKFTSDGKYWIKFLSVIAICAVVVVISFVFSSGTDIDPAFLEKHKSSSQISKLVGAACILSFILIVGAIVSILATEVTKKIKKN